MAYLIRLNSLSSLIVYTFFTLSIYTQHATLNIHKGKYSQYARPVKETAGSDVLVRELDRQKANNGLGFVNISIFEAHLVAQSRKPLTKMSGNRH